MNDKKSTIDLELHDLAAAFSLLTRIPVPVNHDRAGERAADAVWAYPVVGAVIGLIGGTVGMVAAGLGVPSGIAAALALATLVLLTGAMHEDGIADCADGLGGGGTISRRLEIMKDSRIGAYGAVALVLVLVARWTGVETLLGADWLLAFVAVGAASRVPMVIAMFLMPLARSTGLAAGVGQATRESVALALGLGLVICVVVIGLSGLGVLLVSCLAALPLCLLAQKRIGGYTGDVLGGCQQLAEIAGLAVAAATLA
ncbi:MAG: adenosylcobinamide-GDP ribazoletransferase [Rhodobacteraceae bacterium]|nr:adenosylcobinamide-GDP ribazoletransferase [Paracoccaceae bacterium]